MLLTPGRSQNRKMARESFTIHIVPGTWRYGEEVVHALPGADVTLLCVFPKPPTTHIIQTQWSKTDGSPSTKIAVFHPTYGTHYFTGDDTVSLCSTNPNATSECNWWALHLENVTVSLSGQYECTFATYPYGTKAAKIQLTVKAEGKHYQKKVWLKQTLEILCLEDTTLENLAACCTGRVLLGLNNILKVFPTKITDDGRVFSCHVLYHPETVQKSSTTVKVFGKGLMPTACCLALGQVTLLFVCLLLKGCLFGFFSELLQDVCLAVHEPNQNISTAGQRGKLERAAVSLVVNSLHFPVSAGWLGPGCCATSPSHRAAKGRAGCRGSLRVPRFAVGAEESLSDLR
uniref:Immunoglobulin domain-containing protein n=1 Tax=Cyanistes caeruleus TaxID=156563 RepID=A0A8C0V1J0_CYACU